MSKIKNQIHSGKHREVKERDKIYSMIDEGVVCQVAFIRDQYPVVLPLNYGRVGDNLVFHGGTQSPLFLSLSTAPLISVSITHLDGFVMGKAAFNHSVNYRSVVLFGKPETVSNREEKIVCLKGLMEHLHPGRWDQVRPPTDKELDITMVLKIPIDQYSAKAREGGPMVSVDDQNFPVWSGVIPLEQRRLEPIADRFSEGEKYKIP